MIARLLFGGAFRVAELLGSERDTCSYCSHYGPTTAIYIEQTWTEDRKFADPSTTCT